MDTNPRSKIQELEGFCSIPNPVWGLLSGTVGFSHLKGLIQPIKICRCCSLLAKEPEVPTESEQKSTRRRDEVFLKGWSIRVWCTGKQQVLDIPAGHTLCTLLTHPNPSPLATTQNLGLNPYRKPEIKVKASILWRDRLWCKFSTTKQWIKWVWLLYFAHPRIKPQSFLTWLQNSG